MSTKLVSHIFESAIENIFRNNCFMEQHTEGTDNPNVYGAIQ